MHRKRGSPRWVAVLTVIAVLVLLFCAGCGRAHAEPRFSGEFGVLHQVNAPSDSDFAWFGQDSWFAPHTRPTELFANLRLDGGRGSAALCIEGRHTLERRDWLAWEDRVAARLELPLTPRLIAIAGWEQRYRIGEGRVVIGAKIALGRSPKD